MKKIGIALIVIGIVITVFSGISFKTEKSVVEVTIPVNNRVSQNKIRLV